MKSNELLPTYENLVRAFEADIFQRNADVVAFVSLLKDIEGPYSIAIDGQWGSGKTFFVKQAKMLVEVYNEYCNQHTEEVANKIKAPVMASKKSELELEGLLQVPVYYDAWAYDSDHDPLLSLIYEIVRTTHSDFKFKVGEDVLGSFVGVFDMIKGVNLSAPLTAIRGKDVMESIEANRTLEQLIAEFLETLIHERGSRLVIFVDELDRCRPSFAVQLFERVKHYFSLDFITFVFSVNLEELEHTVRACYGEGMNATRYLDRFFDLRSVLRVPDMTKFYRQLKIEKDYSVHDVMTDLVINELGMSFREIIRFKSSMDRLSEKYPAIYGMGAATTFCRAFIAPIMVGLRMIDAEKHRRFLAGDEESLFVRILSQERIRGSVNEFMTDSYSIQNADLFRTNLSEIYAILFKNGGEALRERRQVERLRLTESVKKDLENAAGLV